MATSTTCSTTSSRDNTVVTVGQALTQLAGLALVVTMVYVPLQSYRVGLLTRLFGTLGMAFGVIALLIPQIGMLPLVIWFGWLGFVILDRVPKGRPPAWDAGVAIPWPRPGEEPQAGGRRGTPASSRATPRRHSSPPASATTRRAGSGRRSASASGVDEAFDFGGKPPTRHRSRAPARGADAPDPRGARAAIHAVADLDLDGALERLEHRWLPYKGLHIHLEVHPGKPGAPTFVIVPGLGDHARRQLALATALAERGYATVAVDRQGHGLSEGRRGDATLAADFGVVELAIGYARVRSQGPVVLLGDSLGGIMGWYLLTTEPDIEAAVCHCIGHPDVRPDASYRYKEPVLRALATVLPRAPVSVRQIADYDHVALDPVTKGYFDQEVDSLFNFTVSARSAASYLGFRPHLDWERVTTPVLVMIGAEDRMVTPEFTTAAFERAHPPGAEYVTVRGAGHQLFLDDLGVEPAGAPGLVRAALPAAVRT